jgi:hypothetical protein
VVTNGSIVIFVHEVIDPLPPGRFFGPDEGNRWVAVDVSVQNVSNKMGDYNALDFKVKTTANHEALSTTFTDQEPQLVAGDLDPGETARGWLTFEIPEDEDLATLVCEPFSGGRMVVDLR